MQPLVSVILAVYNGEKYLSQAIESVLAQTHSPIELLVIDDGSEDGSALIAKKYPRVRYFYQSNQGQPAAINLGLSLAQGTYLAFLDADDLFLPNKIALQLDCLQTMPETGMVFGHVQQFISPELSLEMKSKWHCPSAPMRGYLAAAGLFTKETFDRTGLLNPQRKIGLFIDWYMRAKECGIEDALMEDIVLRRRIHGGNVGILHQNPRREYLRTIKDALERREAHGYCSAR